MIWVEDFSPAREGGIEGDDGEEENWALVESSEPSVDSEIKEAGLETDDGNEAT